MADGQVIISTALDNTGLEKALSKISGSFGGLTKVVAKTCAAIVGAFAAATVAITKQAVDAYADYEQLSGGITTLFKDSASKIITYSENAFYTAGVSANKYMEVVTSFSASLISSLGGDTAKAADVANMAMIDMADNANKMGTDIGMLQSAYQGFAKQNYTMLDNLKLGFGGTKTEMQRLLKTAESITGIKYNINNLADVYSAIHVIQEELGIAGATAEEAEKTITGAANMTKAAWQNVLTAIAGGGDLDKAINNLVFAISKYFKNLVPVVQRSITGIGELIEKVAPSLVQNVASALIQAIPSLLNAVYQMIIGLAKGIYQGIVALFSGKGGVGGITAQLNEVSGGFGAAAGGAEDLAEATEGAGKAAKRSLAGFDELNKLQDPNSGGGGAADVGGGFAGGAEAGGAMGLISEAIGTVEGEFEKVLQIIKKIAEYIPVIATGLVGLKLGSFLSDLLTANIEAKTLKETIALLGKKIALTAGVTLAVTGIALETKGIVSTVQEGLNGINFAEIIGGGGAIATGGALIGKFFSNALLGGAIGGIVAGIPAFITGIYDAIVSGIDWLNATLVGVGATAAGAGIGAIIGMLGGPIGAGIGALIGLAVGLVTDLIILIVQKWDEICAFFAPAGEWFNTNVIQPVGEFFSGLWASISQWAFDAWENIKEFFTPAVQWFSNLFNSVSQTLSDIFYNIGVIAGGCWEVIKVVWGIVSNWFNENVVQPVAGFFTGLWDGFVEKARSAWESVKTVFGKVASFFSDTFKEAWAGIVNVFSVAGDIFNDIKDGILTAFKTIVNGIIKGLNGAISIPFNGINTALQKIRDINILGLSPFTGLKTISVPEIPYLAQGAVLPANKPFLAMVGDQRHGTNIEAPLSTIQEAVALVMQDQTAAIMAGFNALLEENRQLREVVLGIQIGDNVIASAYDRYQTKLAIQRGGY